MEHFSDLRLETQFSRLTSQSPLAFDTRRASMTKILDSLGPIEKVHECSDFALVLITIDHLRKMRRKNSAKVREVGSRITCGILFSTRHHQVFIYSHCKSSSLSACGMTEHWAPWSYGCCVRSWWCTAGSPFRAGRRDERSIRDFNHLMAITQPGEARKLFVEANWS